MMKYSLSIILLLLNYLLSAQNLYISSGIYFSRMKIEVENVHTGTASTLDKFNEASYHFDYINIFFEKELGNQVSLKAGFYLNIKSGNFIHNELFMAGLHGSSIIKPHRNNFSFSTIDFPILLTYYLIEKEDKFRLNINIGPYLGLGIFGEEYGSTTSAFYPSYLSRLEYGFNLSTGFGFEKWQMSCYFLHGGKPASVTSDNHADKVRSSILGLNLTRVIYLSKGN